MTHENDATTKTACWKATILFLRGTLLLFSIIAMAWVHRDSAMILESKNHDYTYSRNIPMVPPHPLPKGMSRRINSAASSHRRAQAKQPPQARIVGGTSTEQNEYPYMVALNWDGMNDGKPICGGVLITPSIILTAAHCVFQVSSADLGRYDLRKDDGVVHQKLDWSDRRVHPNYNYKTSDNDVGLIKLTEPYYATHYAVPYNSQSTPSDLTVIGWGRMSDNGEQPSILLKAEVNEVSDSLCTERYSSYDTSSMLCASAPGRDSCQGDSGGPLFERETSFIVGIVSFGYDCADPNYPGVYARVNSFEAWIDETVCDDLNPQDCDQGTIKSQLDPSNVANIGTPLAPTRKHRRRSPSVSPTQSPTLPPTSNPTNGPTKLPTSDPTTRPTTSPTERPTLQPTTAPTAISTSLPTNVPTAPPTIIPTWIASFAPSVSSIPSTFTNGVRSATTNSPIAPTSPSPTSLSHVPSPTISMGSLGASSTDHSALPSAELSSIPSSDVASGSNLPSHTLVSSTYTPGVPSETPSSGPRLSNASGPPMSQSILIVPSLTSHTTPPRNEPTIDATPGPTTSTLNSMLFDVKTFDVLVGDNFNALPTPTPVPAECRDTKFWIGSDHHRLDCRWVEQRVHRRCKNYADYCPSVCKKKDCGSYYENK